jgi:hypothetical protein
VHLTGVRGPYGDSLFPVSASACPLFLLLFISVSNSPVGPAIRMRAAPVIEGLRRIVDLHPFLPPSSLPLDERVITEPVIQGLRRLLDLSLSPSLPLSPFPLGKRVISDPVIQGLRRLLDLSLSPPLFLYPPSLSVCG